MPFIRVRGKSPGDPLHEFDVTVDEARAHPDLYEVLDEKPVAAARPASFVPGLVKNPRAPKRAKRTGETTAPAGADS